PQRNSKRSLRSQLSSRAGTVRTSAATRLFQQNNEPDLHREGGASETAARGGGRLLQFRPLRSGDETIRSGPRSGSLQHSGAQRSGKGQQYQIQVWRGSVQRDALTTAMAGGKSMGTTSPQIWANWRASGYRRSKKPGRYRAGNKQAQHNHHSAA